jgi:hypothetical protein
MATISPKFGGRMVAMTAKLYSEQARQVGAILTAGDPKAASTVYEEIRRAPLIGALVNAGLVDEYLRDRETGRKVGTILRELARLPWGPIPHNPIAVDNLARAYRELRSLPIQNVKEIIRMIKAGALTDSGH